MRAGRPERLFGLTEENIMSYLLNTWYIAGWADELAQGAMLGRTIVEQPIVFFRDSQGVIQALADRCAVW